MTTWHENEPLEDVAEFFLPGTCFDTFFRLDEDLKKFMRRQLQGQMKDVFVDPEKDW